MYKKTNLKNYMSVFVIFILVLIAASSVNAQQTEPPEVLISLNGDTYIDEITIKPYETIIVDIFNTLEPEPGYDHLFLLDFYLCQTEGTYSLSNPRLTDLAGEMCFFNGPYDEIPDYTWVEVGLVSFPPEWSSYPGPQFEIDLLCEAPGDVSVILWWFDPEINDYVILDMAVIHQEAPYPPPGETLYVDADQILGGNGSSWTYAYRYLQDALAYAGSHSDISEIRVAEGTYKPDEGEGQTPGDRTATFGLINDVAIYGGYAGYGEPDPNARDPNTYETILSGDLDGNDVPVGDPCDLLTEPNRAENSYHVVTGNGTEPNAILDGFTVTAGNANGSDPNNYGGGMYNSQGSPTVTNCTFTGNSALAHGGGIYNGESNPTVTNCTFSENAANIWGGGMYNKESSPMVTNCTFTGNSALVGGGGMYNGDGSSPTVTSCAFIENSSHGYGGVGNGGGMYNDGSSPMVTNCTFSENAANFCGGGILNNDSSPTVTNCTFSGNSGDYGGGIFNDGSSPTVTNCTFSGNSAKDRGGGMYNYNNIHTSSPVLTNCKFIGNSAKKRGGGIFNNDSSPTVTSCTFSENSANEDGGGIYNASGSSPIVTNCILWGNSDAGGSDESAQIYGGTPDVNYCCIQGWTGGLGGTGNIGDDPLFVDPNGPDDVAGTEDDNLRLSHSSPCIDTGDNDAVSAGVTTDLDGHDRIVDGDCNDTEIVDMGAYEFAWAYIGDFAGGCDVDFKDFAVFALAWLTEDGEPGYNPDFDIGIPADNYIDISDLYVFVGNWLAGK